MAQLIIEEEDEGAAEEGGGADSALNQLIETKKRIVEVNRQLSKLKKLSSVSKMAHSQELANLSSKRQSSSDPSSIDELLKSSKARKSSGPLIEGTSSLTNRVGEVKGQTAAHNANNVNVGVLMDEVKGCPTVPPTDAVKSDDILNTVGSKQANTSVEVSDPLLSESPVCPDAPLLPEKRSTEIENHDVNIHENAAEIDSLFEDIPEPEEEEDEDSVFIDEEDEQLSIPAQTAAPGAMTADLNGEKDGEAPVIPPSSKSYSSVASSPPAKSSSFNRSPPIHQRQQQQNQQQYPRQQFRASSLPPQSPSTSTDKPVPFSVSGSHTQTSMYRQRPPSPAVYSTRPQGSEFIPIPSVSGASHHPMEQEWPTLHASSQQPRRIRTHNNAGTSNQNASPTQWPIVGSTSPPKSSEIVSKTPPTPTSSSVLGSPPSVLTSSGSNSNFANPLLPTPTVAQRNLPPRFAKMQQGFVASQSVVSVAQGVVGVGQGGTAKRRPAGIGRGGRPLPPLDSSLLGGGVHVGPGGIGRGVPTVRPILPSGGRPPMPPPLYMVQSRPPVIGMPASPPAMRGHALLPSPLRAPVVMPPPITSPIPVSPEERWIYMSRRGRTRSKYDYPPLGSSAGLDII